MVVKTICLLLLLVATLDLSKAMSMSKATSRVVGGEENPEHNTLPFHVAIFSTRSDVPDFQKFYCAGSLIAPDLVLTAAYCVLSDFWGGRVAAGEHDLSTSSGLEQYRDVIQFVVHEDYEDETDFVRLNDIALLKLKSPFELNQYVGLVDLVDSDYEVEDDTPGFMQGWGYVDAREQIKPNTLHNASLTVLDDEECLERYETSAREIDVATMLCAGGVAACGGDTGGALMIEGKQVGVYSWIDKKFGCSPVYPAVFTKVSAFKEWLETNIANLNDA